MSAMDDLEAKLAAAKTDEQHDEIIAAAALEIIQLTSKGEEACSLAAPGHHKQNWVDETGGLPAYICNVAKHMPGDVSMKIAQAVSTIKKWIADPKTSAETKAKATAAIADWNRKRAEAHALHPAVKAAHDALDKAK